MTAQEDLRRLILVGSLSVQISFLMSLPGYGSTAGCESTISYVDGKNGRLLYKGQPIEELVEKYRFTDVAKLLITGEAPKDEVESEELLD